MGDSARQRRARPYAPVYTEGGTRVIEGRRRPQRRRIAVRAEDRMDLTRGEDRMDLTRGKDRMDLTRGEDRLTRASAMTRGWMRIR